MALYNSEEVAGVIRQQKGYRFHYLLQSADHPEEAISITAWDTPEDAEAYQEVYAQLVERFRIQKLFTGPPVLKLYQVKGYASSARASA